MLNNKIILAIILPLLATACQNARDNKEFNISIKDSATAKNISSLGAVEAGRDTTRKFIRTADIKFKVKNVAAATYNIEDIVRKNNGFVTYTKLESIISNVMVTPVSSDSSVETTHFNVVNTITLRVPNYLLDTTLKDISHQVDYLDTRTIIAEDVALQILANRLTQKRAIKNGKCLSEAIDTKAKKLPEITEAENRLTGKEEESDNAFIKNLSLTDQVNYSTVTLYLYQRETVKRELIANDKNISAFEQSFGSKMLNELKKGCNFLAEVVLFFTRLWGLILIGVIAFLLVRKYGHKFKK